MSAHRVARLLQAADLKVVFAESCTGGLVSGALTKIPGISNHHCGGMVVYRNETKTAYLGIPGATLKTLGPVSAKVSELMARRVLELTPEADIAVSVTGHLGPHAPAALDGRVYVAIANRKGAPRAKTTSLQCRREDSRAKRQRWVVARVLQWLGDSLEARQP
jgi:nicotinamide-nucleotide amidase